MGEIQANIQTADQLLQEAGDEACNDLDLLVLPEMAFSGYNFPSLEAIQPYLEPTGRGPSTEWAKRTASRLNCIVNVGYPEITASDPPLRYNTVVSVLPSGEVCATYRKRFLYYTDETWASEPPAPSSFYSGALGDLAKSCAMGICMDINPYKFEAPWTDYEFATHCVEGEAELVVVSMAWLTRLEPEELMKEARSPDLGTLSYWIERFLPVVAASVARKLGKGVEEDYDDEKEVVIVLANRCGMEPGSIKGVSQGVDVDSGEDVVSYAGSSCVLKIKDGNVQIFDMLGKAEESLLVVDTEEDPKFALRAKAT